MKHVAAFGRAIVLGCGFWAVLAVGAGLVFTGAGMIDARVGTATGLAVIGIGVFLLGWLAYDVISRREKRP